MYIHEATKFLIIFKSVPSIKFWKKTSYILKLLEKSENIFIKIISIADNIEDIKIPLSKVPFIKFFLEILFILEK